jgi:hypothetical protein
MGDVLRAPLLLAFAVLAACASKPDPQKIADAMTHAVYANDLGSFTSYLDDSTGATVTRGTFGALSDRMNRLGTLETIATHDADPDKGRYTYDVTFSKGAMLVEVRLDPSGKVGAYRVIPK